MISHPQIAYVVFRVASTFGFSFFGFFTSFF
jgi:hypothetical protein